MSRFQTVIVAVSLSALIAGTPAFSRDLVVDNVRGSDSQNDRGLLPGPVTLGPYRTIGRALLAARSGDRIVLTNTGTPYRECISLDGPSHSGTPWGPFEIVGNGAVLEGALDLQVDDWRSASPGLLQLRFHRPGYGLLMGPSGPLPRADVLDLGQLPPGNWTLRTGRVLYRPQPPPAEATLPQAITDLQVGITIYNVRHLVVRDLTVRGYWLDGVNVHGQAGGVRLENVTCVANGRSGISVGGACRATLVGAECRDNGQAQLRTEGACHVQLIDAALQETDTAPAINQVGGRIFGPAAPQR